jgi:hypothetical protein
MTAYAPSQYQTQHQSELAAELSSEEREKLQEIHELINLLLRELPVTAQAPPATATVLPAVPYTYTFLRFPCG